MRKLIGMCATALIVGAPAAAYASGTTHPTHPSTPGYNKVDGNTGTDHGKRSHGHPTVMYVLRGTLSAYTKASSSTPGSITITVKGSNFERKTLKGLALTFATSTKTHIVLHDGATTITDGDRGIVKVRAAKAADQKTLEAATAFQVIDQGKEKTPTSTTTTT